jgi:hypothetical protein
MPSADRTYPFEGRRPVAHDQARRATERAASAREAALGGLGNEGRVWATEAVINDRIAEFYRCVAAEPERANRVPYRRRAA